MSTRIHPADNNKSKHLFRTTCESIPIDASPSKFTVWKRSSMSFQGTDGFTVFDEHGKLAFRVDNYTRKTRRSASGGLVLMDGAGNALLTLRPQIFSMQCQWNAYREEGGCMASQKFRVFSMRRTSLFHHNRNTYEAEVFMGESLRQEPDFRIDGSFRRRNCVVRSYDSGEQVAKISRKRVNNSTVLLGNDVFDLVVQPGFEKEVVMAFIVVLDRICSMPFVPALCS